MNEVCATAVGGSHDRREISAMPYEGRWCRVRTLYDYNFKGLPPIGKTEIYTLQELHYNDRSFRFWVAEGTTNDEAFEKIMLGYARR